MILEYFVTLILETTISLIYDYEYIFLLFKTSELYIPSINYCLVEANGF